jgi:hypothetical protein
MLHMLKYTGWMVCWSYANLHLKFVGNARLVSKVFTSFYSPISNAGRFQFLHLPQLLWLSFFIRTFWVGVKLRLIVVFSFLQRLILLNIFSCAYRTFAYLLWRNVFQILCPFFKLLLLLLLLFWDKVLLCNLGYLCFLRSTGVTGVYHHTWFVFLLFRWNMLFTCSVL